MKRTPLRRKTPLRSMSKKRQRVQRLRRDLVATELDARGVCEAGPLIRQHRIERFGREYADRLSATDYPCGWYSTDLHEPFTRARGGDILDRGNTVAVCRSCHNWIHGNPEAATSIGLLKGRGDGADK